MNTNVNVIKYNNIDEKIYSYEHKSGLKAFVVPKKGYSKKHATYATHYGSVNSEFVIPGDEETTRVPDGIAHFLEHKLFEQKDGSVMNKFSALGASPNAYTAFNQTVYLFSCTDKFKENFDLLLRFVQNPYITEKSIENEKGIIGQEIRMYEDNPGWRVFFNLLNAIYVNNPVKTDIAGTIESISNINRDILYTCYNTFYHPSNMIVLVVGDVEPEEVFSRVQENIKGYKSKSVIKRVFPKEPDLISKEYVEQKMSVSTPIFQMGFKDISGLEGKKLLKRETALKILLEMIMGRSSELYEQMYNSGIINSSFEFDYVIEKNYSYSIFGGESINPEKVKAEICDEIKKIKTKGLNKGSYERIKRARFGRFLKQLNSVERISHAFISIYFKDVFLFDYAEIYDKISFGYIKEVFEEHFNSDNLALSVVKPV